MLEKLFNEKIREWEHFYNYDRPHGGLSGQTPYERLLGDAMAGDGALFAREDSVEAAWAVVDPILTRHQRAVPYKLGSWGPKQADALLAAHGCWHNPMPERAKA